MRKWFFKKIFNTKFNLGFGTPATDTCSYCLQMKHKLSTVNGNEKNRILAELGAHKLRAKTFHRLMREKLANSTSFCFDLQQVQPLPKLSINEAYYSRQIGYYAFCITDVENKNPQFYVWTENEAGRGSIEVSSALCDFLEKLEFSPQTDNLRLFADGCGGQNKNVHIVHALACYLRLKRITLFFPVRGHSFLPAARVFGVIEKSFGSIQKL